MLSGDIVKEQITLIKQELLINLR